MALLKRGFLSNYPDQPENMNELAVFTAYRTYTRWLEKEQRRETWKEAVARAVEYSVSQAKNQFNKLGYPYSKNSLEAEAEALFDNIFNTRQFLSGRTHWVGGANTKVAEKFPLANFNCSFIEITKWSDLSELFYLLLVGTGVGFKSTKEGARALGEVRTDVTLEHAPYEPLVKEYRIEKTKLNLLENGFAKIFVGDSKEGWVEALRLVFNILTDKHYAGIHTVKISYNSIRPRGEKLLTFGGTASGHTSLKEMFEGIWAVIKGEFDLNLEAPEKASENTVYLRPIHILDIGNLIGYNVVVGGVRRTAEIFLADADDWEVILAKYGINGIWDEAHHQEVIEKLKAVNGEAPVWLEDMILHNENVRPIFSRRMSNNSVGFEEKPSREMLNLLFTIMRGEGEPGFVNLESAKTRRPNAKGLNPCAEILLDSYGVCNLTTVNVKAFVKEVEVKEEDGMVTVQHLLDVNELAKAQALSARAGVRMTLLDLELKHWNEVHKRDRLTGTSLTGWYDAMDLLGYDSEQEKALLNLLEEVATDESRAYATALRIPLPLLITTVKPEGTLSQVAGGVSSGLHRSHSDYYFRRIRINSNDALVEVAKELNWTIHAEVGTEGFNDEESLARPEVIEKATTLVVTFPVKSGAKKTKDDLTIDEQFDTYFMFQEYYTQHNSSNTITVKADEWGQAEQRVWDGWDDFIGVSFLAHDGGNYVLAPYKSCTKDEYDTMKASMGAFDVKLLKKYESEETEEDATIQEQAGCVGNVCGVR